MTILYSAHVVVDSLDASALPLCLPVVILVLARWQGPLQHVNVLRKLEVWLFPLVLFNLFDVLGKFRKDSVVLWFNLDQKLQFKQLCLLVNSLGHKGKTNLLPHPVRLVLYVLHLLANVLVSFMSVAHLSQVLGLLKLEVDYVVSSGLELLEKLAELDHIGFTGPAALRLNFPEELGKLHQIEGALMLTIKNTENSQANHVDQLEISICYFHTLASSMKPSE